MYRCFQRVQNLEAMATETINERVLIEQLGIPEKKLRALRPVGVEVRSGEGVFWPVASAVELAGSMGAELTLPQEKTAPDATEELSVASDPRLGSGQHFPNPKLIRARRASGELVLVRVMDSRKYRRFLRIGGAPMVIRAQPAASGNWWNLVGKEPRWPGQW